MAYYHMKDLSFMPGFIHLLPGLFSQEFVSWIGFVGGVHLEHVYIYFSWCSTTSFGSSVFLHDELVFQRSLVTTLHVQLGSCSMLHMVASLLPVFF